MAVQAQATHRRRRAMTEHDFIPTNLEAASEDKRAALSYVVEAFVEGQLDGIDADCMAQAALFAAFQELVETYGEEAAAIYAEGLPSRIRSGAFSTAPRH
jgi:hypothetical protein